MFAYHALYRKYEQVYVCLLALAKLPLCAPVSLQWLTRNCERAVGAELNPSDWSVNIPCFCCLSKSLQEHNTWITLARSRQGGCRNVWRTLKLKASVGEWEERQEKWLEQWSVGREAERSGAAELSSSELQHWVLGPCCTPARTTQQQTQDRLSFSLCNSLASGSSVPFLVFS